MPTGLVTARISAPCADVFRLLHDYSRRLEWDSLLSSARLCPGWTQASLGAKSVCTGRWWLGSLALETEYVSFQPPRLAAVVLTNRPWFFKSFAASLRHRELGANESVVEYRYSFVARPACFRWLLHPLMGALFRYETQKRLNGLAAQFTSSRHEV